MLAVVDEEVGFRTVWRRVLARVRVGRSFRHSATQRRRKEQERRILPFYQCPSEKSPWISDSAREWNPAFLPLRMKMKLKSTSLKKILTFGCASFSEILEDPRLIKSHFLLKSHRLVVVFTA